MTITYTGGHIVIDGEELVGGFVCDDVASTAERRAPRIVAPEPTAGVLALVLAGQWQRWPIRIGPDGPFRIEGVRVEGPRLDW